MFLSYEAYREGEPQPLGWRTGYMFDGLVVVGWLCWHDQKPVLAGAEPVSQDTAEWVYRLEGRSTVGPGRTRSGRRRTEDGQLQVVFPMHVSPRGEWERLRQRADGELVEPEQSSRRGSSATSSRRGRGEGDRR